MVFLVVHRAELASLVATLAVLPGVVRAHGLLRLPALLESAAGILVAGLVVSSWWGAGTLLARLAHGRGSAVAGSPPGDRPHRALELARAGAYGSGLWSLAWFALGLAGGYSTPAAAVVLVAGLTTAVVALGRGGVASLAMGSAGVAPPAEGGAGRRAGAATAGAGPSADPVPPLPADHGAGPPAVIALTLIAVSLGAALLAALAPPTAKDALQYHLALPKVWAAAGALVVVPGNIASYFPLAVETQGLWAMLLGRALSPRVGEAGFSAVAFAYFPLLLAAVYGWARERGLDRAWATTAVALLATVPAVWEVASSAYVDLALALYAALALRDAARWWATREPGYLAGVALASGFALGVKMLALSPVLIASLVVLLGALRSGARGSLPALAVPAAAFVIGSPWYLRTWWLTGSPVFPFFLDLWPGQATGWDVARSVMLRGFNDLYGGFPKGPIDYLLAPLRLSLLGQREEPAYYEGVLGVGFLVAAGLVLWALARRHLQPEAAVAAAAAGGLVTWWTLSAQVLRYALAAMPPLAVAGAVAGCALVGGRFSPRLLQAALLVPASASALVTTAWFLGDAPFLATLGAESRETYLARRLDYYPYYRLINDELPENATVWLINVRRDSYHLTRPFVGDYLFEDFTIRRWVIESRDATEVRARARAAGITHVFVRHDVLADPARSALVDDRVPAAENRARLERLRAFLLDGTRVLRGDRKFLLAELARR